MNLSTRPNSETSQLGWSRIHRIFLLILVFLLSSSRSASAQQVTADAIGRVSDPTGAVVPNASVIITNTGTHESRKTLTNAEGDFTFNSLQIGSYTVQIEAANFKSVEVPEFPLGVGERHRIDVALQIGSQAEHVEVVSDPPALQTESSGLGQTLGSQAVQDLPTEGRNLYSLVQLAPGASSGPANGVSSGQRPDDRRQASEVSANGQSDSRNNNLLDGMDNNSREGNIIEVRPSIDAIQELSVLTSSYPAEVGNAAGAVVNMLTKSGADAFHGTAYEYFRNDIFDARDYFSAGIPKPELRQNQFGGSLSGPIRRGKTFFFVDAEDLRKVRSQTTTATIPTLYEEQNPGDFTDNPTSPSYVPSYLIDPAGLAFFKLYPAPTTTGFVNNFTASPKGTQDQFTSDVRVDHRISANDTLWGRYSYNKADVLTPGIFPEANGAQPGGNVFGFEGTAHETAMNGMLNYTHIFTSNMVLELKASYTRFINNYTTLNQGNNISQTFGVANINVNAATTGLTDMYPIGYASLGDSTYEPAVSTYNTFQEAGIVAYSKGLHSLKFGASLIRRQFNSDAEGSYPLGIFYFTYVPQLAVIGLPLNSLADMLEGLAVSGQRSNNLVPVYPRFWETGAFVQDDWRVTPKVTLNLGVRYDLFTPQTDAQNRLVNLDLATSQLILASNSNKTAGVNTDYKNFAPRVGFSASVTNNIVLHGAYTISFFPADTQNTILGSNPPYTTSFGASPITLSADNIFAPYFGNMQAPTPAGTDISTYTGSLYTKPKNYPSTYIQQFNVGIQQQFGQNVFTISYVGELGRRINLSGSYDVDLPAPSPLPNPQARAPYAATLPDVTAIYALSATGFSGYNGLQTSFVRHFSQGLSFSANYTWSHSIDDISGSSYSPSPYGLLPNDVSTYDKGNSDLDIRNRFAVSASYAFPFTKSFTGFKKAVLNGWQLNGIAFVQAGSPFTVVNSNPQINIASTSVVSVDRPNRIRSGRVSDPAISRWFDPTAFVPQPFGTAGDSGKNILTGPHQRRLDLSVFRDFALYERLNLQFRAECYDVSNSKNLDQPNSDINSPAVGVISQSLPGSDQRVFQFALKLSF